jgi:hypothetical protein
MPSPNFGLRNSTFDGCFTCNALCKIFAGPTVTSIGKIHWDSTCKRQSRLSGRRETGRRARPNRRDQSTETRSFTTRNSTEEKVARFHCQRLFKLNEFK